jgi:hypothetical protein
MTTNASVVLFKNAFIATLSDGRRIETRLTSANSPSRSPKPEFMPVTSLSNGTEAPASA